MIVEKKGTGANTSGVVNPEEACTINAAVPYVEAILHSPLGKNLLADEQTVTTMLRAVTAVGATLDFGDYISRNVNQMSVRVCLLLLRAKQTYAHISIVLESLFSRILNEEEVIYREDLQGFLLDKGLIVFEELMLDVTARMRAVKEEGRRDKERTYASAAVLGIADQEELAEREKDRAKQLDTLEQVGVRTKKMLMQLYLQLHHMQDEVISGLPLDSRSLTTLTRMLNTACDVRQFLSERSYSGSE